MKVKNKGWKCIFLLSFLCLCLFLQPNPVLSSTLINREEYLRIVDTQNPTLLALVKQAKAKFSEVQSLVAHQRLAINLQTENIVFTGSNKNEQTLSLNVLQKIDIAGKYLPEEEYYLIEYEKSIFQYKDEKNKILAQAEKAFWEAAWAKENVELQKNILYERLELLKVAQEKYKQGMVPELDVIRASTQVEESRSFLTEAEAFFQNALTSMNVLATNQHLNMIPETALSSLSISTSFVLSVNSSTIELILANRDDLNILNLTLRQLELSRILAAKGLSPMLEASLGYVALTDSEQKESLEGDIRLSLVMTVPIIDGQKSKLQQKQYEELIQSTHYNIQAKETSIYQEVVEAQNDWEKSLALEKSRKQQLDQSTRELAITRLMYQEGMGNQLDLLRAQVENQRVQTEYLAAIRDVYKSLAELKRVAGGYSHPESGPDKES
ncbi:TolC family protein [Aminobacterium sp. MB27-C1]|nr:TolC family protein [Aminobacterium sp. MB27-C1]WMI70961.1 TolC family protein [Aminobacterium sp. MB27-C1]